MVIALDKGKSWEEQQALTQRGIAAAQRVAEVAGEAPGRLEQAGRKARLGIRQRAAQGMAGAMGQAGRMVTGGGQAASLRQSAMRAAGIEGEFELGQAEKMIEARHGAAMAGLEAVKFEAETGDPWAARKTSINFFTTEIMKMKMSDASFNDIKGVIESWLAVETDPVMIQWLNNALAGQFIGLSGGGGGPAPKGGFFHGALPGGEPWKGFDDTVDMAGDAWDWTKAAPGKAWSKFTGLFD